MKLYINKKKRFNDPHVGRIIEQDEKIELDRPLLGIEKRYLIEAKEEKQLKQEVNKNGNELE